MKKKAMNCQHCQKEFTFNNGKRKPKFCNKDCFYASLREKAKNDREGQWGLYTPTVNMYHITGYVIILAILLGIIIFLLW